MYGVKIEAFAKQDQLLELVNEFFRPDQYEVLPEETEAMLDRLGDLRSVLPKYISAQKQRGAAYKEIMELLLATDNKATDAEIETIIRKYSL